MNFINFAIFTVVCFTGHVIVSYPQLAQKHSWPINAYFIKQNGDNWLRISGFLFMIGALGLCIVYNPWWTLILCYVTCLMAGTFIIPLMRWHMQLWSYALVSISIIILILFFYEILQFSGKLVMVTSLAFFICYIIKAEVKKNSKKRSTDLITEKTSDIIAMQAMAVSRNENVKAESARMSKAILQSIEIQAKYALMGYLTIDDVITYIYAQECCPSDKYRVMMSIYKKLKKTLDKDSMVN